MTQATSTPAETGHSQVVETFLQLCSIRSEARDERRAADYVLRFLEELGITAREDAAAELIPAGCGNIVASLPATAEGTPIFLCSHLDTVVLADDVVPFVDDLGFVRNEREAILGADNKAAVAVMLELLRELVVDQVPHAGIEVVFTPCEEVGLLGAKHVDIESLAARFGYVFDHADDIGKVVGTAPTQLSLRVTFTGTPSHSGIAPEEGRSAIRAAATALAAMPHGRIDERTTCNIGMISGGSAVNIVPELCELRGEVRSLDRERVPQVTADIVNACTDAATAHGVDLAVDTHEEYRGYSFSDTSPPVRLARAALERAGYTPQLVPCGGGSDANIFNAAGKPCVNLCNGMREIHTPDEHIAVADLEGMLEVARQLVSQARSADPAS